MANKNIDLNDLNSGEIFLLGYDTCLSFLSNLPRHLKSIAMDDETVSGEEKEALVHTFAEIIEQASRFLQDQRERFEIIEREELEE